MSKIGVDLLISAQFFVRAGVIKDMVQPSITAYILIQTTTRGPDSILGFLTKQKIVKESWIVYGDQDVVARIESPNFTELTKLIFALRKHPELKRTKTLICST